MPLFEKPRDEPQSQTEARMLTFGRQLMALITASLALIVVLNPITSASAKPLHFGIFELSDVSGRDFAILRRGKGSNANGG